MLNAFSSPTSLAIRVFALPRTGFLTKMIKALECMEIGSGVKICLSFCLPHLSCARVYLFLIP